MTEYVGFDVSKEETAFCIKDKEGVVMARGKAPTDPDALFDVLKKHTLCPERIVLETGTMSAWLARELRRQHMPIDVIDARQAHAVMKLQQNKTDANDAELLAEIARTGFCRPVAVSSEASQEKRMLLRARNHLIRHRRDTENTIRGLLGSLGIRFPQGVKKLGSRVRSVLKERAELSEIIEPLLSSVKTLKQEIERLDEVIINHAKVDDSCKLLMSVPGVGPVTAMAFVATIDDPNRFSKSRSVGAYLGLAARRHQSGEMDYSGRISKHGDGMLRSLLFEAAHSLMSVVRKAHPLKDWARRIKKRSCHKKACVALARKLAVILHKMLITGEPFRWPEKKKTTMA
jgi:transposase